MGTDDLWGHDLWTLTLYGQEVTIDPRAGNIESVTVHSSQGDMTAYSRTELEQICDRITHGIERYAFGTFAHDELHDIDVPDIGPDELLD